MPDQNNLEQEVAKIKERNARVEADKAWEVSWARRILLAALTYIVTVLIFFLAHLSQPWLNGLIATVGFILSTLTVGLGKKLWLKYFYKKLRS